MDWIEALTIDWTALDLESQLHIAHFVWFLCPSPVRQYQLYNGQVVYAYMVGACEANRVQVVIISFFTQSSLQLFSASRSNSLLFGGSTMIIRCCIAFVCPFGSHMVVYDVSAMTLSYICLYFCNTEQY